MVRVILLAGIRGPCAGVNRALAGVSDLLKTHGTVYALHEPVHNAVVSSTLVDKGLRFVKELQEVPKGGVVFFSAHGTAKSVVDQALNLGLITADGTCPLVTKVHNEAIRYEKKGCAIIIVGHANHQEIIGLQGRLANPAFVVSNVDDVMSLPLRDEALVAYVTQTTLNLDDVRDVIEALEKRFTNITGPGEKDVCFATRNRQQSLKKLCEQADAILVVGSDNSSNSKSLRNIAEHLGIEAYLSNELGLTKDRLDSIKTLGITAGASAPEFLVERVIEKVRSMYPELEVRSLVDKEETVTFAPIALD